MIRLSSIARHAIPALACLMAVSASANYKQLLRDGASIAQVRQLYTVYQQNVLNEKQGGDEIIEELAGGADYKSSFLLACLSNGWTVRAIDMDHELLPPAGVWAFSENKFSGQLRQFPSDCKTLDCADVASLDGFDAQSLMVGRCVECQAFSETDFRGAHRALDRESPKIDSAIGSMKIRTPPRIDYVTVSKYQSDGGKASMMIHVSGANIDQDAVLVVAGNDLPKSKLQTRLDNSSWLGLGVDLANVGYSMDPTYFAFPIYHYDMIMAPIRDVPCETTLTINVRNPDGQLAATALEFVVPTPENLDSDGDGLLDAWENGSVDGLDLVALGANPNRKDLYVEVDQMIVPNRVWSDLSEKAYPRVNIFPEIEAEFARAPILNADGTSGIKLHIDYGQKDFGSGKDSRGGTVIPWKRFIAFKSPCKVSPKIRHQYCDARAVRNDPKCFDANRRRVFRYCIFADQQWSSRSTGGGNKSSIMFLTLGVSRMRAVDSNYQRGVFIHEFGHLLSLGHGGNQSQSKYNYKPNFNSVLNYLYVFNGRDIDGKVTSDNAQDYAGDFVYSYCEGMRSDLDEAQLSEVLGVANHCPIDWNRDGKISSGRVKQVIRKGAKKSETPLLLRDCPDWTRFVFPIGK